MKKDYSFTLTNKPVNSTAARVMSKGEHCPIEEKISKKPWHVYQDTCPPLEKYIGPKEHDLTGKEFGKLTVVGYGGKGAQGARWRCLCSCGKYVSYTAKTLKRGVNTKCDRCHTLDEMRTGTYRKAKID